MSAGTLQSTDLKHTVSDPVMGINHEPTTPNNEDIIMAMEYKKDAVAFLNIYLVAKNGNEVKLPKGLALRADGSAVEQKILELWGADKEHAFTVRAEVKSAEKNTSALDKLEF